MSDRAAVLACFEYFLAYPWPYLTKLKNVKDVEDVESLSVGDVSVSNISTRAVSE